MVLGFALCATFAFAQSNKSVSNIKQVDRTTTFDPSTEVVQQTAGFNGSIFTKEGEYFTCTFAASDANVLYSFGTIGDGSSSDDVVNGTALIEHSCGDYHGSWHRIADTAVSTWTSSSMQGWYPVLIQYFGGMILNNFSSENPNDGFAMMSMIDDYAGWGGTGAVNDYDAYIKFAGFSSMGAQKLRARFYQFYRRFNNDKTYIDYRCDSTGGQWMTIEVNSAYVSNGTYSSYVAYTLPKSTVNNTNLELRYRWVDESGSHNGGYFNIIDDFTVINAPVEYIRHASNMLFEGFYHMMPKDLNVPVVWVHEFANEGQTAANNVVGTIATGADGAAATTLVTRNFGTVQPDDKTYAMIIDPLGFYDSTTDYHQLYYENTPFHTAHRTGNYATLPTSNTGDYYFYTDFSSSFSTHAYGDTATYDTVYYNVNWNANAEHPHGVWAHDHGVIRRDSYYASGLIASNTFSTDPDDTKWNEAGYGVYNMYIFGRESGIPEGWRILGVELTPSTYENMAQAGARIQPKLFAVWASEEQEGYYVRSEVTTGASSHVVTSNEVIPSAVRPDLEYELYGSQDNPTIKMWFPSQPEIDTSITWYVGYELVEESNFAVSTCGGYYLDADDNAVYFSEVPGMEHYASTLYRVNSYGTMVSDPYNSSYRWFSSPTQYPMIRMLIGPSYEVEMTTVTFECDDQDKGYFASGNDVVLCDSVANIPVGGGATYYFYAQPGYELDQILFNGQNYTDYEVTQDEDGNQYGTVRIDNVTGPATLKCIFKEKGEGFDPLSNNVHMKLQPNPATTNVHISLNGVSGNVNMSIIDMSGRVISNTQFNAENGTDVNVSNLAKGAYFVRITNDGFSKVEKLIVR